jgi:hypothetical protein
MTRLVGADTSTLSKLAPDRYLGLKTLTLLPSTHPLLLPVFKIIS